MLQSRIFGQVNGDIISGQYNLLLKLASVLTFVPGALATSLIPKITSRRFAVRKSLIDSILLSFAWFIAASVAVGEAALFLFRHSDSPNYSWNIFMSLLCMYAGASIFNNIFSNLSIALNRLYLWMLSDIFFSLIILIPLYIFLPKISGSSAIILQSVAYLGSGLVILIVLSCMRITNSDLRVQRN